MASKRRRVELTQQLLQLPAEVFAKATAVRTPSSSSSTPRTTSTRTPLSSATSTPLTSRSLPDTTVATPKRRKQRRTTPEGGKLPAAVELRALKVSQKTLDAYHRHIKEFDAWAAKKGYKVNARNLDMQVTRYLTHLALEEEAQPSAGSYLVFGLQLLRCTVPRQSYLPNSKEALAGWKKLAPGGMRLPAPEEFVLDFAYLAVDQGNLDIAFAMVLQYDTYIRPSECLGLKRSNVGFPAGGRYQAWSVVLAPFELGNATKTGTFDDSVLIADKTDRRWLGEAMGLYMKLVGDSLFANLSLERYENWFKGAAKELKYRTACVMPHILRHSGASNDAFHKRRLLQEIQKRGRWQAKKSVTRYEKHALLLKRWEQAPSNRHALIRRRSQALPGKLLAALRRAG